MLDLNKINEELETLTPEEILTKCFNLIEGNKTISLSMQLDGLVLLDMMLKERLQFSCYTIDTGRLHEETYKMFDTIRFKYNVPLEIYYPNTIAIEQLTSTKGVYSFKESIENREECCSIRKIEPNQRALQNKILWVGGLRREQSENRKKIQILEYRSDLKLYKLSPLANYTSQQLHTYAKQNSVSYHPLYAQGYPSIGCAPCTRATKPGEEERAGRWWWEQGSKECGLNVSA